MVGWCLQSLCNLHVLTCITYVSISAPLILKLLAISSMNRDIWVLGWFVMIVLLLLASFVVCLGPSSSNSKLESSFDKKVNL